MTDIAIRCEGLAKQYRIGEREPYRTLRDAITDAFTFPRRLLRSTARDSSNGREELDFWALKDVSFEIKRGEVLGIIGRNGAGKSTLLKILSRITEPTLGHVDIWGRIGSLLEVGTGFHPELSGRDNVFLNGAILGMRRAEIARKFDEIVAFAEVEKFIDTPVKRYSSGMYVRLAFAVAAFLEPEILIIDEVLAVGDAQFQKKSLSRMQDICKENRTVLLVSHNITMIEAICHRAILLDQGEIVGAGPTHNIATQYNAMFSDRNEVYRVQTKDLIFEGISNRTELSALSGAMDLNVRLALRTGARELRNVYIDFALTNERNEWVIHSRAKFVDRCFGFEPNSRYELDYSVKSPMLAPGQYFLIVYAFNGETLLWVEHIDACTISAWSHFGAVGVLDGVRSAIVPPFAIELRRRCSSPSS